MVQRIEIPQYLHEKVMEFALDYNLGKHKAYELAIRGGLERARQAQDKIEADLMKAPARQEGVTS